MDMKINNINNINLNDINNLHQVINTNVLKKALNYQKDAMSTLLNSLQGMGIGKNIDITV